MREHYRAVAVAHSDEALCRNRVAARAGQVVVRQSVEPLLSAATYAQVLRGKREGKCEVIRIVPARPARERQLVGVYFVAQLDAVEVVVQRNGSERKRRTVPRYADSGEQAA